MTATTLDTVAPAGTAGGGAAPTAVAELAVALDAAVDAVLNLTRCRTAVLGRVIDLEHTPDLWVPPSAELDELLDDLEDGALDELVLPDPQGGGDLRLLHQDAMWAATDLRAEVARRIDADIATAITAIFAEVAR